MCIGSLWAKRWWLSARLRFCSRSSQLVALTSARPCRPAHRWQCSYLLPFLRHQCLDRVFFEWFLLYMSPFGDYDLAFVFAFTNFSFHYSQFLRWVTTSILILVFLLFSYRYCTWLVLGEQLHMYKILFFDLCLLMILLRWRILAGFIISPEAKSCNG